ncbi:hypothetical protein C2S52_020317 [Perilla frutescens var. hirtella]|nr:hypothetical protein C2S52_020317 [Perilla frutescens var. hirtella]
MGMEKLLRDANADAERSMRGTMDQHFKRWVMKLQDLLYETDHMLDEWKIANLQLKMEEFDGIGQKDINPRNIVLKTKELHRKIHGIIKEKKEFNFIASGSEGFGQRKSRYESFDSVDVSGIFCRDYDKKIWVGRLLGEAGEDNGDSWTRTISIVSSGGLGKTTLAQLVYNDDEVVKNFYFKGWVWVSDPFDMKMISKKIIKAAGGNSPPNKDILGELLDRVLDSISRKKFLIILDDVWSEDYNKWVPLRRMLKGLPGSRLLVTTRNKKVVRMMGSCARDIQELDLLASDDCWSIISHQSKLSKRSNQDCEVLEHIGRGIAIKCQGLPLVAMSMGVC